MDVASGPIEGEQLKAWCVLSGGTRVRMDFISADGTPHQIVLPFDVLSSLLMTLPRMLQSALNTRFADGSLRLVQRLSTWRIEQAETTSAIILRLSTRDGFEVAFALNSGDADSLGAALLAAPETPTSRKPN